VLDLSLDILNCNSVPTALAKFTKVDQLTGANKYKCEKCNTKVDATKSMSISSAPLTLAIHLKRFNAFGKKISKPVEFEERLNIRPYMDAKGPDVYYKLYGVLVHQGGSTNSGHYYCYVRASNDMWHCMDDSSVSKASRAQVLSERAYMLFYIRTTDSILPPIRSSSLGAVGKGLVVQQGLQHVERPPQVISHKNIDIGHKVERADLSVQGVTPVIPPRRSSLGSAIFSGNVTPKKQNGVKVESVGKPSVNEPSHILVETPEPQERPEAKRSRAQEPSRDQKPLKKQRVDDADSASSSSSATSKHEHMPMTVKPKNKYGVQVTIVEHEPESTDVASLFKSNGLYARNGNALCTHLNMTSTHVGR
jgi:ubiquitin carboxyl-terminal hydrolase 36/42